MCYFKNIMMPIKTDNIVETLKKTNPWFKENAVPDRLLKPYIREEIENLERKVDETELATLVLGGRRVGKSILLYQLIDRLIKRGVGSKHIVFIQGDNPLLRETGTEANILHEVLEYYQSYIIDTKFEELKEPVYIVIDEVQVIPNWDGEIKTIIDRKLPVKFIVTGSSSHRLQDGISNPLVGRVHVETLLPFSFRDYVGYNHKSNPRKLEPLEKFRSEFLNQFEKNSPKGIYNALNNFQVEVNKAKLKLDNMLNEYLYYGGFPYVIENKNNDDITKYLKDTIEMTFSNDILQNEDIRNPQAFSRMLINICKGISGTTKLDNLATNIGVKDARTVLKYIDYYKTAHYIYSSERFTFYNKQNSVKTSSKIYLIDTGVINTVLFKTPEEVESDPELRGPLLENLTHNSILRYNYKTQAGLLTSVPHWINTKTHKEIDFIMRNQKGIFYPVEVKSKDKIGENEKLETFHFLKKYEKSSSVGIIVTAGELKQERNIMEIPGELFCYMF